jgi:hypothetical protein
MLKRFNLEEIYNNGLLENLLLSLYKNHMLLKNENNRKGFIEFSNNYFLFLAKIFAKTDINCAFTLLKLPCPDDYLELIHTFSENFIYMETTEGKKLVNYFFLELMKLNYQNFSKEVLLGFAINMVKNLTQFGKNYNISVNDNIFDIKNDAQSDSTKFNTIYSAKVDNVIINEIYFFLYKFFIFYLIFIFFNIIKLNFLLFYIEK